MHGYRHQTMQLVSIATLHAQCTIHTCATASLLTSPWDNHHGWLGLKSPKLFKLISWNHGFLAQPQTDCCDFNNSSLKSAHCLGWAASYLTRQADYSCNQSCHLCSHAPDAWCSHWKRVRLIFTGNICADAGDGGRWGGGGGGGGGGGRWKGEGGRKEGRPKCVKMKPALTSVLPLSDCNSSCTLCKSAFAWTQKQGMCGVHTVKAAFYNNNKIYTYKYITSFI